jgi:hypothetical protein
MGKVKFDIAQDSVNEWLDHKRISANKRESLQGMIDNMVEAVVSGDLALKEDMTWEHVLIFPPKNKEGVETIKSITYKPRISEIDLAPHKRTVKGNDFDASLKRTILALTGQAIGVINNLDSSTDKQIADSIAVFFV